MFCRVASAAAVAGLLLVAATGCTGTPVPVETSADALTEDEAFAAAEQTYRAYVDALNRVDLSDPETFEPVYALTTGEANADFRKSFSRMHADGWSVAGDSVATVIERDEASPTSAALLVCIDVSDVVVVDESGASQVDADRRDVQPMRVTFTSGDDLSWSISKFDSREGDPECDG